MKEQEREVLRQGFAMLAYVAFVHGAAVPDVNGYTVAQEAEEVGVKALESFDRMFPKEEEAP